MPAITQTLARTGNTAQALTVALSEADASTESWKIEVFGRIGTLFMLVGPAILTPTAASLGRGTRVVALATLPGATEYQVVATPQGSNSSVAQLALGFGDSSIIENETLLDPQRPTVVAGPAGTPGAAGAPGAQGPVGATGASAPTAAIIVNGTAFSQPAADNSLVRVVVDNLGDLVAGDMLFTPLGNGSQYQIAVVHAFDSSLFLRRLAFDGDIPTNNTVGTGAASVPLQRFAPAGQTGVVLAKKRLTLVGGTVDLLVPGNTTTMQALVSYQSFSGTPGTLRAAQAGVSGGSGITVTSSSSSDTSNVVVVVLS